MDEVNFIKYPYIMKTFSMLGGVPVWHNNLQGKELSEMYGYIEVFVIFPRKINRPFLPYKNHNNTLLFPTGKWVGVYYSEELKFAQTLGYRIVPLRGYLFEEKSSPFDGFVSSLFAKRLEAKKAGDEAMSFTYKILMNTLYGRLGINPESTNTEVCDRARYDYLVQHSNLILGDKLSEHYYIVSYKINTEDDHKWNPPRISAVHIAAAVTACSRMHMYKYISRPDCYYTDTDSAVLGSPLPEDEISSTELGKLKIEHFVKQGIFLAPKTYSLKTEESGEVVKHKGPAKNLVDVKWFESQLQDLSRTEDLIVKSHFRIDWHTLNIGEMDTHVRLGVNIGSKRVPIYDTNNVWVDTKPKEVLDFGGQDLTITKLEMKIMQEQLATKDKELKELATKDLNVKPEYDSLEWKYASLYNFAKRKVSDNSEMDKMRSEIARKEAEIVRKEAEIDRKEAELARTKEEMAKKEEEMAKLRSEIAKKEQDSIAAKLYTSPTKQSREEKKKAKKEEKMRRKSLLGKKKDPPNTKKDPPLGKKPPPKKDPP